MRFDAPLPRAAEDPPRWPPGHDWFTDDVAVDFPALRPMVERMRSAFFAGEEPDVVPLAGELRLTIEQAARGGRVPVEVPVRRTCHVCGGRGETWGEACAACAGHGDGVLRRAVDVLVPSGVHDGACLFFRLQAPASAETCVRLRVWVG